MGEDEAEEGQQVSYATISDCETYRYLLGRWVGEGRLGTVLFLMLNPSVASASVNDPTIIRCTGFARSWGYSMLEVVNLFSFRATDPWNLRAAHNNGVDVVGPLNDQHITEAAYRADLVVCAWGAQSMAAIRYQAACQLVTDAGKQLHCIDTTKDGQPRHPLMLEANLTPKAWAV